MPVDPGLIAGLISANPPAPAAANANPEAVGTAAAAQVQNLNATAAAIDNYTKSILLQVAQLLTTPGAFVSPMGPCSPGAVTGIFAILGAPTPPATPTGEPDDQQINKIVTKVIDKIKEQYILTPKT